MSPSRKSVWQGQRKAAVLICGNQTLPVRFGRPLAPQSRCRNNKRGQRRAGYRAWGFKWKRESVVVVYFCFCIQTESKTTAASGSGGPELEIPLLLSCSRFASVSSVMKSRVRAHKEGKKQTDVKMLHSAVTFNDSLDARRFPLLSGVFIRQTAHE